MSATLDWHGKEMSDLVEHALRLGIDKTASEGSIEAKGLVHFDTTTLQGSIRPDPAKKNADGQIEGAYGPHRATNPENEEDVMTYAVYQEFLPGEWMPDPSGEGETMRRRRGGKPYMRPSMKTVEKNLPGNIAAAYRSLS
jgi:hypothetical protein